MRTVLLIGISVLAFVHVTTIRFVDPSGAVSVTDVKLARPLLVRAVVVPERSAQCAAPLTRVTAALQSSDCAE